MTPITQQEAVSIAMNALQKKNIPFRQENVASRFVTTSDATPANSTWLVSFDIPMPLGMQDECFTVEVEAHSGEAISIITPTQTIT